jgi:hypothetical protein
VYVCMCVCMYVNACTYSSCVGHPYRGLFVIEHSRPSVCMYACMCIYVCMYACMYTFSVCGTRTYRIWHTHTTKFDSVKYHTNTHVYKCMCIYKHTHTHTHTTKFDTVYNAIQIHMCINVCLYINTHTHTLIRTNSTLCTVCTSLQIRIHICINVHTRTQTYRHELETYVQYVPFSHNSTSGSLVGSTSANIHVHIHIYVHLCTHTHTHTHTHTLAYTHTHTHTHTQTYRHELDTYVLCVPFPHNSTSGSLVGSTS